jgi:SAM-dependent methyltransferase
MRAFHKDKDRYFQMQYLTARDHIVPFLSEVMHLTSKTRVLEVGCGEAGVLLAFLEKGCQCVGIELSEGRTEKAMQYHKDAIQQGQISFINRNIYDIGVEKDLGDTFDLIILKDVIEHIPDQDKVIQKLGDFLKPQGRIFFGFPPWYMPFGGHQQICRSKILSSLPYHHLLPKSIYRGILKGFGEPEKVVKELLEIKDTGISIERFEKIIQNQGFVVNKKLHFLINPIYFYKFNLKPRKQFRLLQSIRFVRNFFTTAVYYVVSKKS